MRKKHFFGIVLIALGVFLLLNNLEVIDLRLGELFTTFWPMILVFYGFHRLINHYHSTSSGLIIVTIGVLLQLRVLGIVDIFEYTSFWPSILILLGVWVFLSTGKKRTPKKHYSQKEQPFNLVSKNKLQSIQLFSSSHVKNVSKDFIGGEQFVAFGNATVNLTEAQIAERDVTVDVVVAFGHADMIVPKGWNIEVNAIRIFGRWTNNTILRSGLQDAPTLTINGVIMFGEMTIRNG
ncbi:DUF5668 domain-containing protein [Bacillus spongiae]|uniref:DUF5668 domain-containing protein n=1 Tax=Bacillus spongiae TaxID=2683610 RepID=A0ABU8HGW0_9BACI